jgi:hypothetical protein
MAKIRFLKEGEPSQKKNYLPEGVKADRIRRKWKIFAILSGVLNVLSIYYILNQYFNN